VTICLETAARLHARKRAADGSRYRHPVLGNFAASARSHFPAETLSLDSPSLLARRRPVLSVNPRRAAGGPAMVFFVLVLFGPEGGGGALIRRAMGSPRPRAGAAK